MTSEWDETMEVSDTSAQLKWQTEGVALSIPTETTRARGAAVLGFLKSCSQPLHAWVHHLLFLRLEGLTVTADLPPRDQGVTHRWATSQDCQLFLQPHRAA